MTSRYERRWENAKRIWKKLDALQRAGFMIFDAEGERVTGRFVITENMCVLTFEPSQTKGGVMYFINDTTLDNGMFSTIKEFNDTFIDWTFIHPGNVKSLHAAIK